MTKLVSKFAFGGSGALLTAVLTVSAVGQAGNMKPITQARTSTAHSRFGRGRTPCGDKGRLQAWRLPQLPVRSMTGVSGIR